MESIGSGWFGRIFKKLIRMHLQWKEGGERISIELIDCMEIDLMKQMEPMSRYESIWINWIGKSDEMESDEFDLDEIDQTNR